MPGLGAGTPEEGVPLKVLSLYWGFTPGGVAKYATMIDDVKRYEPIEISHLCIIGRNWHTDDIALSELGADRIEVRYRADPSWLWKVRRAIARRKPDLLLTHGYNGHLVALATGIGARSRVPNVCSYHGPYHPSDPVRRLLEPIFNRFTENFLRRHTLSILSVSGSNKDYLSRRGVTEAKITVIHNGLDDLTPSEGARARLRAEWGVGPRDMVVGTASRLDPNKGVHCLISASARLAPDHPNVKTVIVGAGPYEQALRELATKLGMADRILFAGFRSDVPDCLAAFDVFVLPSFAESHSIGLLEAMRAGKPIVATGVGGNTESVRDGREAIIVPPGDATALAEALSRLLGDSPTRERLRQAARQRFESEFSLERMLRRTAEWLMACGAMAREEQASLPAGRQSP